MASIHILFILKCGVSDHLACTVTVTQLVLQQDSHTSVVHTYFMWKKHDAVNHQNTEQSLPAEQNTFWNWGTKGKW